MKRNYNRTIALIMAALLVFWAVPVTAADTTDAELVFGYENALEPGHTGISFYPGHFPFYYEAYEGQNLVFSQYVSYVREMPPPAGLPDEEDKEPADSYDYDEEPGEHEPEYEPPTEEQGVKPDADSPEYDKTEAQPEEECDEEYDKDYDADTCKTCDDAPADECGEADESEEPAEPNSTLYWYLDGQRRMSAGRVTYSTSPVLVELRFEEVAEADMGVWTLRAYGGYSYVESPYALFLIVGEIKPLAGIMPLSNSVSNEAELRAAIAAAGTTPTTIELTADINLTWTGQPNPLDGRINIPNGADITLISGPGGPFTIRPRYGTSPETIAVVMNVQTGGTLTIDGVNISHPGRAGLSTTSIVQVIAGGHLTLESGEIFTAPGGSNMRGVWIGSNVDDGNGEFVMNGGVIRNNTVPYNTANNFSGGGIHNWGSFTMNGGVIRDNRAQWGGGVQSNVDFTMNGGEIHNNFGVFGGGLHNSNGGEFEMNGGQIRNNDAGGNGGGVFNWDTTRFYMYGGEISYNTVRSTIYNIRNGGGVLNQGVFTMRGGVIHNNRAYAYITTDPLGHDRAARGGGVAIIMHGDNPALFTMYGGVIRDNNGGTSGGGVYNLHGTFNLRGDGQIIGNTAGQFAGVENEGGTIRMTGGLIANNTNLEHNDGVQGSINTIFFQDNTMDGGIIFGRADYPTSPEDGLHARAVVVGLHLLDLINGTIVVAWQGDAGPHNEHTSTNLTTFPAGQAHWARHNDSGTIRHGVMVGSTFVEVPGVTVNEVIVYTPPTITSGNTHEIVQSVGGTFQVTADGSPTITFALENAPSGVEINEDTGLITFSGTLDATDHTFTIRASNPAATDGTQLFTLTVEALPTINILADLPTHEQFHPEGVERTISVAAEAQGAALAFQWFKYDLSGTGGYVAIPGQTSHILSSNVFSELPVGQFRIRVRIHVVAHPSVYEYSESSLFTIVPISHSISLNAQGGTFVAGTNTIFATDPANGSRIMETLPTPTRMGFNFLGWYTTIASPEGVRVTTGATGTQFTNSTWLHARWTPVPALFDIFLNLNGGSVDPAVVSSLVFVTDIGGTLQSQTLPTPTRTGFTFDGWYTALTGGVPVTPSHVFIMSGQIFARWTPEDPVDQSITSGAITITAPVRGAAVASATASLSDTTTGTIAWTHNGTPADANFGASRVYTAVFTLTADAGFNFNGLQANTLTIDGATVTHPEVITGNTVEVTAVFPATAAAQITDPGPGDDNNISQPPPTVTDPAAPDVPAEPPTVNVEVYIREEELIELVEQNEDFIVEGEGVTLYIPNEILAALFDAENPENITVELNVSPATHEAGHLLTVEVSITVGEEEIEETAVPFTVAVSLDDFDLEDVNIHRIVAIEGDGTILGGRLDAETGLFVFETGTTGEFTIAYVEDLVRLSLNINSPIIYDLADNAPIQHMDTLPILQDGRTLVPIRFIAEALGAEVSWTPAADGVPMTIHITINGETLSFAIGEITPELYALGMDVPAQLIDDRTMVPLRFISEFFGAVVTWDAETQGIEIVM